MFQKDLEKTFTNLKWRASFVKSKMKTRVTKTRALEIFRTGRSLEEIVDMFAHQWWERHQEKKLDEAFYATGFTRTISNHLDYILKPLLDTCYTHSQILDLAIDYLNGKYDPIGQSGNRFLFDNPNNDEWFSVEGVKQPVSNLQIDFGRDLKSFKGHIDSKTRSRIQNPKTVFYHATNWACALDIMDRVRHFKGRQCLDFGMSPSFYCTPNLQDALQWCAKNMHYWKNELCIIVFQMPKELPLKSYVFGKPDASWKELIKYTR